MTDSVAAPLRVIQSGALKPASNMALDLALLQSDCAATLRIYEWKPAGLSIGWFQDAAGFEATPGEHHIVRRPTGGGAIYHGDEITFALVGPDDAFGAEGEELYPLVHDAIGRACARHGIRTERIAGGPAGPGARALRGAWCFEHPARHDLIGPDGRKICGSAQRRLPAPRSRILQHGSLVLTCPAATPFCAAAADQVDTSAIRESLSLAMIDEIAAAAGRQPVAGQLTAEESAAMERLTDEFLDPATRPCRSSKIS